MNWNDVAFFGSCIAVFLMGGLCTLFITLVLTPRSDYEEDSDDQ